MKELMELGSRKGIAGRYELKGLNDVMSFTPFCDEWEGQAGRSRDSVHVVAVLSNGRRKQLDEREILSHASNYEPPQEWTAPTVGEQIAGLPVVALEFTREEYSYDQVEQFSWTETVFVSAPDWSKVRRRIEDALRKTEDNSRLYKLAVELGVKIY